MARFRSLSRGVQQSPCGALRPAQMAWLFSHGITASATEAAQAAAAKKVEELGREVQKKAAEVDQLKAKLRQYSDYDEIKRELEIMKASSIPTESGRAGLKVSSAGSRVRWSGGRRRHRR